MTKFHELHWHDARLVSVHIDRSEPGQRDEVQLAVQWPTSGAAVILFRDVYAVRCELNFGVIADEIILSASEVTESVEITQLRDRWRPAGVILEDLKCFELETASTASRLQIYARGFDVSRLRHKDVDWMS
jgi:hypothetical protein